MNHADQAQQNQSVIPAATALDTSSYLAAVASSAPTPGGGSVAGVVGALAAALGEMVCQLSLGRNADPDDEALVSAALLRLSNARHRLLHLAVEDESVYAAYRSAADRPKDTPAEKAERRDAMQAALEAAARVPLVTATACRDLLTDIDLIAEKGNPHVRSDALIAAILAEAAVRASSVNVRVNTAMLRDKSRAADLNAEIATITHEAAAALARVVEP